MRNYLHFIWGFIGVFIGFVSAAFVPGIQGKWDMTSLAGLTIVILFALISADRLKEYSERLEKQHEQLKQQLNLDFQAESQRLKKVFNSEAYNNALQAIRIEIDSHYHSAHLGEQPISQVTKDEKGYHMQDVWGKAQKP